MTRLTEIFDHKRAELVRRKAQTPQAEVMRQATLAAPSLDFAAALCERRLRTGRPALIAEIKQASPSRGQLVSVFEPAGLAQSYVANGAAAISVLTDADYFRGSLNHLRAVRAAAPTTPLLRKDFICDPYQVYEARGAGADALLLIVAELAEAQICELQALAQSLGMAALIEVHTAQELAKALRCEPRLIGINNRNLHDFTVHLATTRQLKHAAPEDVILVAESGIFTAADVATLCEGRSVDAVLVGEALMTAQDITAKVRELAGSDGGRMTG